MTISSCWPTISPTYVVAIDHVGIAVADLEAAKAWYLQHLGLRAVHEEVNDEQGVREVMLAVPSASGDGTGDFTGSSATLPGGPYVQLLAPLRPDSPIGRFLDRSGPGVQQVAYRVRDLDGLSTHLGEQGVSLLYDAPRRGTAGSRVNFIHPRDAGGVLVELVEYVDDHVPGAEPADVAG